MLHLAQMLALAFPDRIGARRHGKAPRFIPSGGKGAIMRDALASQRYIVAIELMATQERHKCLALHNRRRNSRFI